MKALKTHARRFFVAAGLLVALIALPSAAAVLELESAPVILGRTESVNVNLQVDEPEGTADRPLRLSVNVGSFGPVTRLEKGRYRAVYTPPPTRFPQVALVAIWRETGPEAKLEFARIPLHGVTKLPVRTRPGAEVTVKVEQQTFGPEIADKAGRASLPINVPPGIDQATVTARTKDGLTSTETIKVEVPPYNRLTMALVPHAVLVDGSSWARLEVVYDLGGGDLGSRIQLAASSGKVLLQNSEEGRASFRYEPPAGSTEKKVSFSVSMKGDPTAKASAELSLGLPPPARLLIYPPEKVVADGKAKGAVKLLVTDANGLGLGRQTLEVTVNGQRLPSVDLGQGNYEVSFTAPERYPEEGKLLVQAALTRAGDLPLRAEATLKLLPSSAVAALTASFSPAPLPADGKTAAEVLLELRDAAGEPLEHAKLSANATHGMVGAIEELGQGRYRASYVGPDAVPDAGASIEWADQTSSFKSKVPVPLRPTVNQLQLGVRAAYTHSLSDQSGPRVGLDAWVPMRFGGSWLGFGLSASYGFAAQTLLDGNGNSMRAQASYVPLSARLGLELYSRSRFSVAAGAGGTAVWANHQVRGIGLSVSKWGFGVLGFASANLSVGPGVAFVELSYAHTPIKSADFELEGGGAAVAVGYRLGLF